MTTAVALCEAGSASSVTTTRSALRDLKDEELALVKGGFVCGGLCAGGLVAGAIVLLGAGIYVGWKDDHNDTVRENQGTENQGTQTTPSQ